MALSDHPRIAVVGTGANGAAIGADLTGRVTEYVDHLHEHFTDPVVVADTGSGPGYVVPTRPGYSTQMHAESVARFRFPDGPEWTHPRVSEAAALR